MRTRRIRFYGTAALVLAVLSGIALWAGALPDISSVLAQEPGHEGHAHAEHDPPQKDDHGAHEGKHDEHDDGEHEEHGAGETHEDEEAGHGDHAGHDHGDEERLPVVRLSPDQMSRFGVRLATAGPGTLHGQIRLPGEVMVNADRAAHIVPPAGGVARAAMVSVGDSVAAGQAMAVLESGELSEAKTAYLAKLNELQCCSIDLARAEALAASAKKLLETLEASPSLEALRNLKLAAMDEGHSDLIGAYGEYVFAEEEYEREKRLVGQDISSRAEYQTATSAYKKAFAGFFAARDALAYQTQRSLLEARQTRQNLGLELVAAERKLHILGVSDAEVHALKQGPKSASTTEACDDPNCTECEGHGPAAQKASEAPSHAGRNDHKGHEDEMHLGNYSLRAPFAGTVIERHVTRGEMLSSDESVFTVADLSTVWVDLSVYQKDLPHVRKGQAAHIRFGQGVAPAEGRIAFVSPILDGETRTARARVVLDNPDGLYRPGLFVTADVDISAAPVQVLVPKAAVQLIENENVVFVPTEKGLAAQPVKLGRSSRTHVEITSGLRSGRQYVAAGAFQLKAQIVTSGLGAHAGHGH